MKTKELATEKFPDYSFDGFGINGKDEYRERLATITEAGQKAGIGPKIAVALNSFEAMREALKKTLAVVRLQNGNLYEDINEIQTEADNALLLSEGKAVQS